MKLTHNGFWSVALSMCAVAGLAAQGPAQPPKIQMPEPGPTFKVQVDYVEVDALVTDQQGQFVRNLTKDDFEVYEDGVKQDVSSMTLVHGGRVTNVLEPPPAVAPEGIILPPSRPVNDTSGRIFLFFVDDLHMEFRNTGRIRDLFRKIQKNLLHDGDMWGMVSSGPSSLAIDMTYDKNRFEEAIKKITGNGLKATDIINGPSGADGPSEVRYRAHVAFSTVEDVLNELEKVHNRRKALVYVSDGYDFNPFQGARTCTSNGGTTLSSATSPFAQNYMCQSENEALQAASSDSGSGAGQPSQLTNQQIQNEEFADADMARELADLTRTANRANVTMYTIDPRGLVGQSDLDEQIDPTEWNNYIRKSQDSLRVLADETGGLAVVNQNDFDKALKRIDAETSDYYVLGYYSKNPDPLRKVRKIDVKVVKPGVSIWSRKGYSLKQPPKPKPQKTPSRK